MRCNFHAPKAATPRPCGWRFLFCTAALLVAGGCVSRGPKSGGGRDINLVLAAHDRQLLVIPGVVGVYVGLLPDEKTPCLKVMVTQMTPELKRALPQVLEGHPVVAEVTGEIRPLR